MNKGPAARAGTAGRQVVPGLTHGVLPFRIHVARGRKGLRPYVAGGPAYRDTLAGESEATKKSRWVVDFLIGMERQLKGLNVAPEIAHTYDPVNVTEVAGPHSIRLILDFK